MRFVHFESESGDLSAVAPDKVVSVVSSLVGSRIYLADGKYLDVKLEIEKVISLLETHMDAN